ncbi:MAG: YraN family protein [Bacteroidetes bacterium]|nr:YraN family protein [Bacteroidota bacterium]
MKCIYKNRFGKNGEITAMNFLKEKGLKFVRSNYRYERAEIDLIFEDEKTNTVIFAEVKTRKNKKFGEPEESVNPAKQERIKKAAMGFILENESYSSHDLRIDVISILFTEGVPEINHIENAF